MVSHKAAETLKNCDSRPFYVAAAQGFPAFCERLMLQRKVLDISTYKLLQG